jgi:L-2,4-diaminobutyrate decarboxylase
MPVMPECNIVCFRYVPKGVSGPALDELQARIRTKLIVDGSFYLVQTRLRGALYLRVTLINPLTSAADLDALLEAAREAGKELRPSLGHSARA